MNSCLYVAEELFCSNMNINLSMWRAVIGLFLSCKIRKCFISGLRCYSISSLKFALFFTLLLLCHGDVESNPGPKKSGNCQPLKFCHWNLNSILSENCFKVSLLKSFNALHNYDFICLSKTFLSLQWAPRLILLTLMVIIYFDLIILVVQKEVECVVTLRKVLLSGYWK